MIIGPIYLGYSLAIILWSSKLQKLKSEFRNQLKHAGTKKKKKNLKFEEKEERESFKYNSFQHKDQEPQRQAFRFSTREKKKRVNE